MALPVPVQQAAAPKRLRAIDKQAKALDLRRSGASYRLIARELGCSISSAHSSVMRGLATSTAKLSESAAVVVGLELERLDALLNAIWDKATSGSDLRAVDAALKISERRMRILGIERTKFEMSGPDGGPIETVSGYDKVEAMLERYAGGAHPLDPAA